MYKTKYEVFTWKEYSEFDPELGGFSVLPLNVFVKKEVRESVEDLEAHFPQLRFIETPSVVRHVIEVGENYCLRPGRDELNFVVGDFKELNVVYLSDFFSEENSIPKELEAVVQPGQLFCCNRLGDAIIENSTSAPIFLYRLRSKVEILKSHGIRATIESALLPVKPNVFLRLAYLSAKNGFTLNNVTNVELSAMGCYPDSLSRDIQLFVVDKISDADQREAFLDKRTLAGLFPLKCSIITKQQVEESLIAAKQRNRFPVILDAGVYIKNLESFIFSIHRRYGEFLRGDGEGHLVNPVTDEYFKKNCVDLYDLYQNDRVEYFSNEEFVGEKIVLALSHIFTTNFTSEPLGQLPFQPNTFVSVCSGLMPISFVETLFQQAPSKTIFIDQNFRTVEMWRDFLGVRNIDELAGRVATSQRIPRDDTDLPLDTVGVKRQIASFIEKNKFAENFDPIKSIKKFQDARFVWDNFIERPDSISTYLERGDRPFIWLSNSFYSTPSYHLYSLKELELRFQTLIATIAEALGTRFWRSKVGFKAVFGKTLEAPCGVVWDDMLNFEPGCLSGSHFVEDYFAWPPSSSVRREGPWK